jgi:hypothetical protein
MRFFRDKGRREKYEEEEVEGGLTTDGSGSLERGLPLQGSTGSKTTERTKARQRPDQRRNAFSRKAHRIQRVTCSRDRDNVEGKIRIPRLARHSEIKPLDQRGKF